MKKNLLKDTGGMTLIEMIVAFSIFAVAMTILAGGFLFANRMINSSNEYKEASQKGTSLLEQVNQLDKINELDSNALPQNISRKEPVASKISLKVQDGSEVKDISLKGNYYFSENTGREDVTQEVFVADAGKKPDNPSDSDPKNYEYIPQIPTEKAYFDEGVKAEYLFMDRNGYFLINNINNMDGESEEKDIKYNKGVVKQLVEFLDQELTQNDKLEKRLECERISQLFFIHQGEPFKFELNARHYYNLDFLYLGDNENPISINGIVKKDISDKVTEENAFILKNYVSEDKKDSLVGTLVYLPKEATINVNVTEYILSEKDGQKHEQPKLYTAKLEKGFYLLSDQTDLLKAAYVKDERDKYYKTLENGGFKITDMEKAKKIMDENNIAYSTIELN